MPTLKQRRDSALEKANELFSKAEKDENGAIPADVQEAIDAKFGEIDELDKQLKAAAKASEAGEKLKDLGTGKDTEQGEDKPARSLGEHFVKSVGEGGIKRIKNLSGTTLAAPEFKANTDVVSTGKDPNSIYPHWLTDVDTNFVREYRRRPVVADLLGVGSISGTTIRYYLEGALEGTFTTVAESGQKPQISYLPGQEKTDAVKKLAAWFDLSDEMIEDLPFFVSEINNRGLEELAIVEEGQLLNGDGLGSNVLGLLNREGIQDHAATSVADRPDALFRASSLVQSATGLSADALVIHPLDYQDIRLSKDANGQYFGGGFFTGQYGQGGIMQQPPIWGLNTVITTAVPQGTALVGALKQAATVYRKGGVRVESTNSDQGKFTQNIVTTRIEERIGLAVRRPAAVVRVNLTPAQPTP